MQVTRWTPLGTLQDNINKMFESVLSGNFPAIGDDMESRQWSPVVDIYENDDSFVVEADLPGMSKDDIHVDVQDHTLTIRGEKKFEEKTTKDKYMRVERAYGSFFRSLTLPANVDSSKIKAKYKDGVLQLTLPKSEEAKPKQIKVEAS